MHQQEQPAPRARIVIAMTATALFTLAAGVHGQERPERILDQPNINGIWRATGTAHWNLEPQNAEALENFWQLGAIGAIPGGLGVVEGGEIPYRPEAREQRDANRAAWPAADPEANCYLPGIPRANYMTHPFQIVQDGEGDILFAYEYASANRVVFIDRHREPPIDTWMGESNGHWEGDTLVVVTTGFNGESWLDRAGNFAGAAAVVTERFTPISDAHMEYEVSIENPQVFTRPWSFSMLLYRDLAPNAQLMEFRCVPFSELLLFEHVLPPESYPQDNE